MTNRQSSPPERCLKARDLVLSLMEADNPWEATPSGAATLAPGSLSSAEQSFLNEHLADCPACRGYQSDLFHLTQSIGDLDEIPVPDGLADRIMARIDFNVAAFNATEHASVDKAAAHPTPKPISGSEKHLHSVPNANVNPAETDADALPRIGTTADRPGRRPLARFMAPVAAAVLLLALVAPRMNQWLQPNPAALSGASKEIANAVPTPPGGSTRGVRSNTTDNSPASLSNAISASQIPARTVQGSQQSESGNAVVALVPKTVSSKGGVTGNNSQAGSVKSPSKATAPKSTPQKSTQGIPHPAAGKSQTSSSAVAIASVPRPTQSSRHSNTRRATNDAVDGQEIAYDPVTHLFGSDWAVDEFGNAVSVDATGSSGNEIAANSHEASTDTANDTDGDDPLSTLVGF